MAPKPATPAPASTTPTPAKVPAAPVAGGVKTLSEAVAAAQVKRCPKCTSDGVAMPSSFRLVQGRVVFADGQTYRGHEWYADTGELLAGVPVPVKPAAAVPPPKTTPAT